MSGSDMSGMQTDNMSKDVLTTLGKTMNEAQKRLPGNEEPGEKSGQQNEGIKNFDELNLSLNLGNNSVSMVV